MLTAILVDDELECLVRLKSLLAQSKLPINVLGTATTVAEAVKLINSQSPQLVFLDIELPDGSGFEVLEKLAPVPFKVIFTTAHNDYAIKAFRHNAVDYLLKPIQLEELGEALKRAMPTDVYQTNQKRLELMLQTLKSSDFSKLVIPSMDSFEFVEKRDIIYCMSESNYTEVFLNNQSRIVTAQTLKRFEELLPEPQFCRVHKSFIINLQHVKKLNKGEQGTLLMANGTEIPVSRRRREEFMVLLGVK